MNLTRLESNYAFIPTIFLRWSFTEKTTSNEFSLPRQRKPFSFPSHWFFLGKNIKIFIKCFLSHIY